MNPTPNAFPVLAVSKQSGQPFPSYCWILYFPGSRLNSAWRLLAGCAPWVVWPIDSAHQRWSEASIKKHGASLLRRGGGSGRSSLRYVPTALNVWTHAGLWWAIEPRFSIPLCGRRTEYPRTGFFQTHDNQCRMATTPLTRTNPPEPRGKWIWHVIRLMSSLLHSHTAQMTLWTMSDLTVKTWWGEATGWGTFIL